MMLVSPGPSFAELLLDDDAVAAIVGDRVGWYAGNDWKLPHVLLRHIHWKTRRHLRGSTRCHEWMYLVKCLAETWEAAAELAGAVYDVVGEDGCIWEIDGTDAPEIKLAYWDGLAQETKT